MGPEHFAFVVVVVLSSVLEETDAFSALRYQEITTVHRHKMLLDMKSFTPELVASFIQCQAVHQSMVVLGRSADVTHCNQLYPQFPQGCFIILF